MAFLRTTGFLYAFLDWLTSVFFLLWLPIIFLPAYLGTFSRRKGRRKPRIIWGPTPILTISINSKAERRLGYKSDTFVFRPYYLTKRFDYNLERLYRIFWMKPWVPWPVFLWAIVKYDIFHFFFDRGFLLPYKGRGINRIELRLLKILGKKVIISAYGGDVRYETKCRREGKYNCCIDCDLKNIACICSEKRALDNVRYISRYADLTLSMGDMIEYTPGSRNDVYYWGIDLQEFEYVGVKTTNDPVVLIVHAANHRNFKGTRFLLETVASLKKKGYPIVLKLVEGLSNQKARLWYAAADIVAEQFIIGWHGYFAVEAMALGKPVVCFIRKPEQYLPENMECPIINGDPDHLESCLISLVENPILRAELGRKGRRYVEELFNMDRVGKRLDGIYSSLWK